MLYASAWSCMIVFMIMIKIEEENSKAYVLVEITNQLIRTWHKKMHEMNVM